ncbi:hypothetical protein IWZ00DRAFT_513586 [Phyllosticta capitalensis]
MHHRPHLVRLLKSSKHLLDFTLFQLSHLDSFSPISAGRHAPHLPPAYSLSQRLDSRFSPHYFPFLWHDNKTAIHVKSKDPQRWCPNPTSNQAKMTGNPPVLLRWSTENPAPATPTSTASNNENIAQSRQTTSPAETKPPKAHQIAEETRVFNVSLARATLHRRRPHQVPKYPSVYPDHHLRHTVGRRFISATSSISSNSKGVCLLAARKHTPDRIRNLSRAYKYLYGYVIISNRYRILYKKPFADEFVAPAPSTCSIKDGWARAWASTIAKGGKWSSLLEKVYEVRERGGEKGEVGKRKRKEILEKKGIRTVMRDKGGERKKKVRKVVDLTAPKQDDTNRC